MRNRRVVQRKDAIRSWASGCRRKYAMHPRQGQHNLASLLRLDDSVARPDQLKRSARVTSYSPKRSARVQKVVRVCRDSPSEALLVPKADVPLTGLGLEPLMIGVLHIVRPACQAAIRTRHRDKQSRANAPCFSQNATASSFVSKLIFVPCTARGGIRGAG